MSVKLAFAAAAMSLFAACGMEAWGQIGGEELAAVEAEVRGSKELKRRDAEASRD